MTYIRRCNLAKVKLVHAVNVQGSLMKRVTVAFTAAFFALPLAAQVQPTRPPITGIARVRLSASDLHKSREFYHEYLGMASGTGGCVRVTHPCFSVNDYQRVELLQITSGTPESLIAEIAFATPDVAQMHAYLLAHNTTVSEISRDPDGLLHFELHDPEGQALSFVQQPSYLFTTPDAQISTRLIHAGFVVKNLAAENRFYVDLLGFRLYWYGGFKDDGIDWFEIQVPDGNEWIEYMLNIPATADHKERGVQNHFSLAVSSAQLAAAQLHKRGLKSFDGPEIGRDGKNSLDAYDPDGTRVEVMEFKPAQEPCCHPYTAAHPKP
jgi:catechol 2,3-dioxygenase-like lactoylglutathione lyase family enzyme